MHLTLINSKHVNCFRICVCGEMICERVYETACAFVGVCVCTCRCVLNVLTRNDCPRQSFLAVVAVIYASRAGIAAAGISVHSK